MSILSRRTFLKHGVAGSAALVPQLLAGAAIENHLPCLQRAVVSLSLTAGSPLGQKAVSYTHLTLPTILLV